MARIALVLDQDFEDSEFRVPYDRLRKEGHEVTIIGKEQGEKLKGKKGKESATTEQPCNEADPKSYDALVIPGGYSPDHLRMQGEVVSFVRSMVEDGKPVAAICHAGSLLVEADVVRDKRVTSWPSIRTDLTNAGAKWENEEVVEDGNLVTSRHPGDLDAFCDTLLRQLEAVKAGTS